MDKETTKKEKKEKDKKDTILSASKAIQYVREMPDDVLKKQRKGLLNIMIWHLTEAGGKYNQRYISEGVKQMDDNGKRIIKGIRLEHVHTRKGLIDSLLNRKEIVKQVLENAIGCLVTKEEHGMLPHKDCEGWDRYRKAHIRVWNTDTNEWKIDKNHFFN